MFKNSRFVWLATVLMFAISACGPKDEEVATTVPFDLPPQEGFLIKFDTLDKPSSKAITDALSYYDYSNAPMSKIAQDYSDSLPGEAALSGVTNHFFAGFNVGVWGLATAIGMAIPTASFVEAFNHTPTSIGGGKWQWAYSVTVLLKTYDARLVGSIVNDQVVFLILSRSTGHVTLLLAHAIFGIRILSILGISNMALVPTRLMMHISILTSKRTLFL